MSGIVCDILFSVKRHDNGSNRIRQDLRPPRVLLARRSTALPTDTSARRPEATWFDLAPGELRNATLHLRALRVLVSAVVEGAAGERFDRVMVREVFDPLGMKRTRVEESDDVPDIAHHGGRRPDYSCDAGGGALLSTPEDLVRFGSAMLKPGLLMKAETLATFQTPTRLVSGVSTSYALGWGVEFAGRPTRVISHRGSPAGGTVTLLKFPELGLAVAVAANEADATGVPPLAGQVAQAFSESDLRHGTSHFDRDVRRPDHMRTSPHDDDLSDSDAHGPLVPTESPDRRLTRPCAASPVRSAQRNVSRN